MIESLLNYSEDTLKTQFSVGLFYKDTPGAMDSTVIGNGLNRGLNQRAVFTANLREVHLLGPLNSVDLRIKLTHANDAFCLMGVRDSTFRLRIPSASLFVKKVSVSPAPLQHTSTLIVYALRFNLRN